MYVSVDHKDTDSLETVMYLDWFEFKLDHHERNFAWSQVFTANATCSLILPPGYCEQLLVWGFF